MKPGGPFLPPHMTTPQERAERRARIVKFLIGTAVTLPLLFAVMAYGYSDQAPAALRGVTMKLDGAFGSPVWEILRRLAS